MLKSEIREKSKAKSIFKGCFDKHFKSNEKKMKKGTITKILLCLFFLQREYLIYASTQPQTHFDSKAEDDNKAEARRETKKIKQCACAGILVIMLYCIAQANFDISYRRSALNILTPQELSQLQLTHYSYPSIAFIDGYNAATASCGIKKQHGLYSIDPQKKKEILSQHNNNPYMVGFLIADAECQARKNQLLKKSKKKSSQKKKNKSDATYKTDNPQKEEFTESEQKILTDYIKYNKPVSIQLMTPALKSRLFALFKYPNTPDSKKFQIAQHLRQTAFKYKKCFDKRLSNHGRKK